MLFDSLFLDAHDTRLLPHPEAWPGGASDSLAAEPVYLPANADCPYNRIVFAHGFFSSALHEVAHWCIAGRERRKLVDYGYWYRPDDRNAVQQVEFERVEIRPQAIEWAFCLASGYRFQVSADNLSGVAVDRTAFTANVHAQLAHYFSTGFPPRAQRFIDALCNAYGQRLELPSLD